ncbi:TPA: restriction endonuclease subunit S [Streptococcus suis]|nr:restriction endonuclease subunit S [Streptococcus suis]HEM4138027.1 restriction endonuclease subunit S [Streptococcus suis]
MKTNNNIPAYRFQGYTDAWELRKLGELGEIVTGSTPPIANEEYYSDKGIPWITPTDIDTNIISDSAKKLSAEGAKIGRVVRANSILCTCIASIGKNALLTTNGSFNQQINSLTPYSDNDSYFLLTSSELWSIQMKQIASSGTMQIVNKTEFSELRTMVPSLPEQEAIGTFFSTLDRQITLHQRKFDTLKEQKKTYLKLLIPAKGQTKPALRFQGFEDDWEEVKVADIFQVTRGQVLSTNLVSDTKSDEYPYPVYSSQTKNNGLMGFYKDYLFDTAITWTTDGANAGTVRFREGKFYSTNVNGVLLSAEGYNNLAISEILNTVAWKYVSKVGNPKLMNNIMSEIILLIPGGFAEQEVIGTFFSTLDQKIAQVEDKLASLKEMKKTLLRKLFV